jgi:hypothetical protein
MKSSGIRCQEMFIRSQQFCVVHSDVLPSNSRGAELLSVLDAVIKELEGHATAQDSGKRASREGTALKNAALASLQEDMKAISRTARAMALTMPGLDDKFRMPQNVGAQGWLTAARTFATEAEPLKDEFIRRGMAANFLEDFKADIAALQELINSKAQKTGAGVAATAAIDDAIERGLNAVRELDAIVRNIFRDNPAVLAEWTSANHIERAPRRANGEAPPAPPAPAKD